MKKFALIGAAVLAMTASVWGAEDCDSVVEALKLPIKLKTRGKPKRARWEILNKTMPRLREDTQGLSCRLTFGQVFRTDREDIFVPVLDSMIRTAPEESLTGLAVYYLDGTLAGRFANPVVFEKTNYTQYYFQFVDTRGELQSANRDLLDFATGVPIFLFKWDELKDKVLVGRTSEDPPAKP